MRVNQNKKKPAQIDLIQFGNWENFMLLEKNLAGPRKWCKVVTA